MNDGSGDLMENIKEKEITEVTVIASDSTHYTAPGESDEKNEPVFPGSFFYKIESIKRDHISPSGKWAVITTFSFFTGCINSSLRAKRLIPPSSFDLGKPYLRSPLTGHPIFASWALIW
jgi:hypothetical protein